MATRGAFLIVLGLGVGCGGKTDGDEVPGPVMGSVQDPKSEPPTTDEDADAWRASTELGPCTPGFDPAREPRRECAWIAEGRCYDTKLDACACVCPRTGEVTSCVSDLFPEANGRVTVTCD